jgi:hypothetical protein
VFLSNAKSNVCRATAAQERDPMGTHLDPASRPAAPRLRRHLAHVMLGLGLAPLLTACPLLDGGGSGGVIPDPPSAGLTAVVLVERPNNSQIAAWFCHDLAGNNTFTKGACEVAFGTKPSKPQMKFVFDTRFELSNPNGFPIPLVEILLGFNVFEGAEQAELGAICVSFCDPEAEECAEQREDACRPADKEIRGIEDFVPTVDDLITIANRAVNGDLLDDENLKFRVIPSASAENCGEGDVPDADGECPGIVEASIRFELGIEAMLQILGTVVGRSVDALLSGGDLKVEIPYSALGTLFFDVPVLGRFAVEFGPLEDVWIID